MMKTKISSLLILALVSIATISIGRAQETTASNPSSSEANAIGVIPQLEQAYSILANADHDYKGHRAKAMGHIKAAIRHLGASDSAKDGHVRESQAASDNQLRSALGILEQVQPKVTARALLQVQKAIEELNIALRVR